VNWRATTSRRAPLSFDEKAELAALLDLWRGEFAQRGVAFY